MSEHERDRNVIDAVGASPSPNPTEPVIAEPLGYVGSESGHPSFDPEKQPLPKATRTVTQTTTTSSLTIEPQGSHVQENNKPWCRRLNALKSRREIPVPKKRTVSREYGASFFSMLTFQWMAPLMKVHSLLQATATISYADPTDRLDTNGHWN